jgi:hypothetical protein
MEIYLRHSKQKLKIPIDVCFTYLLTEKFILEVSATIPCFPRTRPIFQTPTQADFWGTQEHGI